MLPKSTRRTIPGYPGEMLSARRRGEPRRHHRGQGHPRRTAPSPIPRSSADMFGNDVARCCQLGRQTNHKPTTISERSDRVEERKWLNCGRILACVSGPGGLARLCSTPELRPPSGRPRMAPQPSGTESNRCAIARGAWAAAALAGGGFGRWREVRYAAAGQESRPLI